MLVTLMNGLQIRCSLLGFHTNEVLTLKFRGSDDIMQLPRPEHEFLLRPIIVNDREKSNRVALYLNVDTSEIQSIVPLGDCPYNEPLHNHHDGCPSCEYDGGDDVN